MFNSEEFRKYLFNTSWLFFQNIIRLVAALFVGVYVARYLGPSQYGLLNYSISYIALFSALATLGLDNIVIRELVIHKDKRDLLLGTAFLLKIAGSFLLLAVLAIGVQFTSNDSLTNLLIAIIAAGTLFQATNVIDYYFQSKVQSKFTVQVNFWTIIVLSILKLYAIHIGAPLLWFAVLTSLENAFLSIGYVAVYKLNRLSLISWKFDLNIAISLLKNSWPLIFSGIVISLYMRIDQVMIKQMLDSQAVGLYAAAVKLSEAWYFVPTIISSSLFPAIIKSKSISENLYYERLQQLYDFLVIIALSIVLPTTLLSKLIIATLYGQNYLGAGTVLSIHIWAGLFIFVGVARDKWILTENLQRYTFIYTAMGAIVNIILNTYLIPPYGINGAAFATLISQFVAVIFAPLLFKETRLSVFMIIKAIFLITTSKRLLKSRTIKN
ncbi:MAG: hypothetical protein PWQ63_294 [Methanolobus sp.]|nr:hypothetical protein [Methanolobus sp.]